MNPKHQFVRCCDLEVHVTCWGDSSSPAIVMWHGLTRTGRDFDELARGLAKDYYVICPDTIGRGLSQWSQQPEQQYVIPFYVELAKQLLQALEIQSCVWIGTSMGGLIGILLAAEKDTPIKALLVNDVGPELPREAIQRISDYVGIQPVFNSVTQLEQWLKSVYVTFGKNSEEFWRRMAMTSSRRLADGRVTLHYDPAIAKGFSVPDEQDEQPTLWAQWQAIGCPVLIVQGAESDLLTQTQLEKMCSSQPNSKAVSLKGIGHAPTLVDIEQQQLVHDWLKGLPA
jgi:pimeloyl-ACP methyl ester carboxylesterase